jgi:twinkle protein
MKLVANNPEVNETQHDLVDPTSLIDEGARIYASGGLTRGSSTGWPMLDNNYTVKTGQWTVVTGMPGSGKSEFLDAMFINLAENDDWEFCMYSPENWPVSTHLIKLTEKHVRKPFNPGPTPRMSLKEYQEGSRWVTERFYWIDPEMKTPDELIKKGLSYRQRGRKLGILLDPWNTLDHERQGMNETDYISTILTQVTRLARRSNAHIWLVAHPTKIPRGKDNKRPVPTPWDISGSAHWWNKADNCLCVHRDQDGTENPAVSVHVQKVRFKFCGRIGTVDLQYDRITGRYFVGSGIAGDKIRDPEARY